MGWMDAFHGRIGKPELAERPPAAFLKSKEGKVDDELIALWKEDGWARYGNGMFWTVDPRSFEGLREEWPQLPEGAIVFARNAFADLYLLQDTTITRLQARKGDVDEIAYGVDGFLGVAVQDAMTYDWLLEPKLFDKVRKREGDLERDECYGLFPPLPLGGNDQDAEAYRRVKIREYLALSAQAHAG